MLGAGRGGRRSHRAPAPVLLAALALAMIAGGCGAERPLNLDLSGAQTTGVLPINGVNTNFFLAPERLGNEGVWEAVEQAEVPLVRFPGGRGNHYDWRTGEIRGEGQTEDNVVPLDDFMASADRAGVSVSYVLNVTDAPESIRQLARHWERTNAPVGRVEMGNEFYLPKLVGGIGGPSGYLKRARTALEALREGGYDGPVGLVAAPGRYGSQDASRTWNARLAGADTSGFDAVILHYYPALARRDFETVYREAPPELGAEVGALRERFPGKRVWVTEWNLGNPPTAPEFNTLGHALFDLRMLGALLEARVDLACYHVLTGRGWELLGPDRFALDYDGADVRLVRRVPYFAFRMAGEAMSGDAEYLSRTGRPPDGIEYVAFRTEDELRVVVWTLGDKAGPLKVRLDGASLRFLGGEALGGDLNDTNGSLLRMKRGGTTQTEEVRPVSLGSPRIEGPGAVLLRYALEAGGRSENRSG